MVLLAGTTGLRRSELIALRWRDIDFEALQLSVNKSCVRGQMGETKTTASARPVPIHPTVVRCTKGMASVQSVQRPGGLPVSFDEE